MAATDAKIAAAVNKSGFLYCKDLNWAKYWFRFEGTTDKGLVLWTFYTSPPVQQTQVK
jgi:hypothetical protein